MSHLENHHWYADFLKGFLIVGQTSQDMLQLAMLVKILLFIKSKPNLADCDLNTVYHRLAMLFKETKLLSL